MKNLICTLLVSLSCSVAFSVPTEGQKIIVAGPSPYSAEIARDIYKQGGNVVDVAVAVALGLSVTSPYYASLGGGGFALVELGKGVEALDFRETAPAVAHKDLYKDQSKTASVDGGLAVGVPGIPAGLKALHERYGKLPWKKLFTHAEKLATEGFLVSGEWSNNANSEWKRFNSAGKRIFAKSKGDSPLLPGDLLKQPELAAALKKFKEQGSDGFYKGEVAKDLVQAVKATGGVIELSDLSAYKVRWLKAMETTYLGHTVYMMPLPSSSGVVMTMALKLAERMKLSTVAPLSSSEMHLWGEILKFSFRQRMDLGDPDFSKKNLQEIDYEGLANQFVEKFKTDKTMKLESSVAQTPKETQTTHFSVLDSKGNSVAMTITLNGMHGSGVMTPRFGIMLNNEMDDFNTKPGQPNQFGLIQGEANNVEAGKRPLSSMSPTLVKKDGKVILSLGSPGGPRIISSVLQVLHRVIGNGFDIDQAIQSPRVHHQFLPDKLFIDKRKVSPDTIDALTKRGHKIEEAGIAKVYGVHVRDSKTNDKILEGAFDSRGEGGVGGF